MATPRDHLRVLRPHPWIKNVLVFAPLVAVHETRPEPCTYVLNDLLDRESRRRQHRHGSGHHRPPPPVGWNRSCGRCW